MFGSNKGQTCTKLSSILNYWENHVAKNSHRLDFYSAKFVVLRTLTQMLKQIYCNMKLRDIRLSDIWRDNLSNLIKNSWNAIQLETRTQFRYFKLTNCINVSVAFVLGYVRTGFSILILMITLKEYSAVTGFLYIAIIPTRCQTDYRISNFSNVSFFSEAYLCYNK